MAQTINLNNLLRAIHNAVIEAQKITEQQHIRQLRNYFEWPTSNSKTKEGLDTFQGGKARTWTVKVPNTHPDAGKTVLDKKGEWIMPIPEMVDIHVPLLSLVPISAIKIDNMTMEFQVGLRGFIEKEVITSSRFTPSDPDKTKGPLIVDLGGEAGGFFGKREPVAKLRIEFKSAEPSEAIMRINDYLIKSIL